VLAELRHSEVLEDEYHHEDVVGAQGLLDDVAGQEGERHVSAGPHEEPAGEAKGERDPDGGPDACFLGANLVCLAVKHAEVECKHREDEGDEADPEPNVGCEHVAGNYPRSLARARADRPNAGRSGRRLHPESMVGFVGGVLNDPHRGSVERVDAGISDPD
jgi:hypothetical protein